MSQSLDMFVIEKEINKNVIDPKKRYRAMCRFIKTTKEYSECKPLYDIFISEVANYIHNIGIKEPDQATIFLDLLLKNGILSITKQNNYHLYKNDREYVSELFGARSISGVSVYRHMSSLISDILNMEHYASWLNGRYISSIAEIDSENPYNHAVVGVVCNNGKIIYDPTTGSFAAAPQNIIYSEKSQSRIAETFISFTELAIPGEYLLLNSEQYLINPDNEQELIEVWYTPLKMILKDEFDKAVEEMTLLYRNKFYEICDFKKSLENTMQRIANLESLLHPHSDSKILKWELNQ